MSDTCCTTTTTAGVAVVARALYAQWCAATWTSVTHERADELGPRQSARSRSVHHAPRADEVGPLAAAIPQAGTPDSAAVARTGCGPAASNILTGRELRDRIAPTTGSSSENCPATGRRHRRVSTPQRGSRLEACPSPEGTGLSRCAGRRENPSEGIGEACPRTDEAPLARRSTNAAGEAAKNQRADRKQTPRQAFSPSQAGLARPAVRDAVQTLWREAPSDEGSARRDVCR